MRNMHIADIIFNRPLLIAEDKLNVILHLLGPRLNLNLSGFPEQQAAVISGDERRRAGYSVQDGIAVIGVYGPLMNRVMRSEFPSGGPTTYAEIRSSLDTALADDGVKEVKLEIDSPGGDVAGAFDLADHIYASRSLKPITAVVNEKALSAGYLLASACSRIVMPRTANVGSVGVIMTHADFSRAEDEAGITVTHIIAGTKKAHFSPHQPLSPEAFADANDKVQETYGLFAATVSRNRGISEAVVRATEAGIFGAAKALQLGLADEILPAAEALGMPHGRGAMPMTPGASSPDQISAGGSASEINQEGAETMTEAELKEKYPALYAAVFQAGQQAAIDTERARVVGILGMPGPGAKAHQDLLLAGIRTGLSAGDVALSIQAKEGELLEKAGQDLQQGSVPPAPVVDADANAEQGKETAGVEAIVAAAEAYNARR